MDNLVNPTMQPHLTFPVLSGSLKRDTRFQMLAVTDLARTAVGALISPERWAGLKLNLASDAMTVSAMNAAYHQVTGRTPRSWPLPSPLFRGLAPEFATQLRWHNKVALPFVQGASRSCNGGRLGG